MKLLILLALSCCIATPAFCKDPLLRLVDKDRPHIGIECEIKQKDPSGTSTIIGKSDQNGCVFPAIKCLPLHKITFIPKSDHYQKTIECPITIDVIKLTSIEYTILLVKNAEYEMLKGNNGAAALAFTDASARIRHTDFRTAETLAGKAYYAAAKKLGVKVAVVEDRTQRKNVMSKELYVAIEAQQEALGLKKTGKLDFLILNHLSSKKLSTMMFSPPPME